MRIQSLSSPLFERLMKNETLPMGLCSILIGEPSILPLHFDSFWIHLILCSLFQKKDILLTMPAVNVSLNISKEKRQTANVTILCKSCSFLYLNTSKDTIIPEDHMALLICLPRMKQRTYTGSRIPSLLSETFILLVSTYLTIVHIWQAMRKSQKMTATFLCPPTLKPRIQERKSTL